MNTLTRLLSIALMSALIPSTMQGCRKEERAPPSAPSPNSRVPYRHTPQEIDALIERAKIDPRDPLEDYPEVARYSVYNSNNRVPRFNEQNSEKGKPSIEDWVNDDFPRARVLVFAEGTERAPEKIERAKDTYIKHVDCPICFYDKPMFGELAFASLKKEGNKVAFAYLIEGPLARETLLHRRLTSIDRIEGFPAYGIAVKTHTSKWKVLPNITMTFSELTSYLSSPEFKNYLNDN